MTRTLLLLMIAAAPLSAQAPLDILIVNGRVLDGAGNPWVSADVGVRSERIAFVGDARAARVTARDTVDAAGRYVSPGFIDAHSHADLESAYGRQALPQLYQGITTVIIGVDGDGTNDITETFTRWRRQGIAINAATYVGLGPTRTSVMGREARAPTAAEMERMKAYVRKGMDEGALGLSTGLFYVPQFYATTDEVVELNRVAAEYGGVYDTHDRDLGALYPSFGYLRSTREAIEIGERAGTPVIFSHFNPQGAHNYGRAPEGAALIDSARARGVNVMAAQHPYTATQSNLMAYTLPRWASGGGTDSIRARYADQTLRTRIHRETMEMLEMRGGAEKIFFVDPRPELNGRTLAQLAEQRRVSVPAMVQQLLSQGNATVMNLDLYDTANTRYLATREWMMTCTDGRTPDPKAGLTHPRAYGAFPMKLRMFVKEDPVISLPFAVRGMTSLATTFLNLPERGLIRTGFYADLLVFDVDRVRDVATYEDPHHMSEGMTHIIVNGKFAVRDGRATGTLAGQPITRAGGAR
jgi:N-acyl-D-amino-acid deacylase